MVGKWILVAGLTLGAGWLGISTFTASSKVDRILTDPKNRLLEMPPPTGDLVPNAAAKQLMEVQRLWRSMDSRRADDDKVRSQNRKLYPAYPSDFSEVKLGKANDRSTINDYMRNFEGLIPEVERAVALGKSNSPPLDMAWNSGQEHLARTCCIAAVQAAIRGNLPEAKKDINLAVAMLEAMGKNLSATNARFWASVQMRVLNTLRFLIDESKGDPTVLQFVERILKRLDDGRNGSELLPWFWNDFLQTRKAIRDGSGQMGFAEPESRILAALKVPQVDAEVSKRLRDYIFEVQDCYKDGKPNFQKMKKVDEKFALSIRHDPSSLVLSILTPPSWFALSDELQIHARRELLAYTIAQWREIHKSGTWPNGPDPTLIPKDLLTEEPLPTYKAGEAWIILNDTLGRFKNEPYKPGLELAPDCYAIMHRPSGMPTAKSSVK